jgi:hypothetical protein
VTQYIDNSIENIYETIETIYIKPIDIPTLIVPIREEITQEINDAIAGSGGGGGGETIINNSITKDINITNTFTDYLYKRDNSKHDNRKFVIINQQHFLFQRKQDSNNVFLQNQIDTLKIQVQLLINSADIEIEPVIPEPSPDFPGIVIT